MFSIFNATALCLEDHKIPYVKFSETSSTNDLAKNEAFEINVPLKVYLADAQTHGRGRGSHTWLNSEKPGDALLVSWSFALSSPPQAIAAPIIGLAAYQALKNFESDELNIKAPNDVYLAEKKILGLLIETVQSGDRYRLIIGMGLNIFSHPESVDFAGHLAEKVQVNARVWNQFFGNLAEQLHHASRSALATHLSEMQRQELLMALNRHPLLKEKYTGVSPFGDLISDKKTISWRDI